jgi:hypothetical protein
MKCIRCQHDCRHRDRADGKCPKCRGQFAFEPQAGDPFTDRAFQNAILAVSADGNVRWGVEHLYYELCRQKRLPRRVSGVALLVALPLFIASWFILARNPHAVPALAFLLFSGIATLGFGGMFLAALQKTVRVQTTDFRRLYEKWLAAHGPPAGVIIRKEDRNRPHKEISLEADIGDYSFDRAVICDRARTVDVLLANNFHFENNCAVLSVDGYPPGPFATIRKMLQQNPRLKVFALHDATPVGCELAHQLATAPDWFAGQIKVIDVGLRPSHATRFRGLFQPAGRASINESTAITAWEAQWLSRYTLELAAIRPEQLIKRLFKAVNLPINMDLHQENVLYLAARRPQAERSGHGAEAGSETAVIVTSAGDSDGPADAFG